MNLIGFHWEVFTHAEEACPEAQRHKYKSQVKSRLHVTHPFPVVWQMKKSWSQPIRDVDPQSNQSQRMRSQSSWLLGYVFYLPTRESKNLRLTDTGQGWQSFQSLRCIFGLPKYGEAVTRAGCKTDMGRADGYVIFSHVTALPTGVLRSILYPFVPLCSVCTWL